MVLQALGLPASGKVQIEPGDLEGRQALVDIRPAEYTAPTGDTVRRNEVPYDGFHPLPLGEESSAAESSATESSAATPGRTGPGRRVPGDDSVDPSAIPF